MVRRISINFERMFMKFALIALAVLTSSPAFAAKKQLTECETSVYNFAVTQQHKDYNAREWKKSQPSDPDVSLNEEKKNGFETWNISYGVDEECLEGYEVLVKRANDGVRCHVIKVSSDSQRDCG